MENRTVIQHKVWQLELNPVTANAESCVIVALSDSAEKLIEWMEDLKSPEMYEEGGFHKTFKKDSPLEMYNPMMDENNLMKENNMFGQGISWNWVSQEGLQAYISHCENSMGWMKSPELLGDVKGLNNGTYQF